MPIPTKPDTLRPPAIVEVAVVDVARNAAIVGVLVETRFPFASVERSMFAPAVVMLKLATLKFVAKKLVEVADVPVAFTKVKFWRVDEPVMRRFGVVMRPAVVRDPVKFAAEEIV